VTIFTITIGHSTRPINEFINLLTAHGVQRLIDVPTIPQSRRNQQFGREPRPHALTPWARVDEAKVTYPGLPLTPRDRFIA
jgi:hypothetical protein